MTQRHLTLKITTDSWVKRCYFEQHHYTTCEPDDPFFSASPPLIHIFRLQMSRVWSCWIFVYLCILLNVKGECLQHGLLSSAECKPDMSAQSNKSRNCSNRRTIKLRRYANSQWSTNQPFSWDNKSWLTFSLFPQAGTHPSSIKVMQAVTWLSAERLLLCYSWHDKLQKDLSHVPTLTRFPSGLFSSACYLSENMEKNWELNLDQKVGKSHGNRFSEEFGSSNTVPSFSFCFPSNQNMP